jgi:DNA-binding PadR family transcriptional regulator
MSGMYKKIWKMCSCGVEKYPPTFMKKMWKMWCERMEKYPPTFIHGMGMHASMMPHKLVRKGIKIVILMALRERPLSGYAIMKQVEEKYGYSLHADVVYPTLQMLDDMGLVAKTEEDNKKIYAITDDGKQMLQDQSTAVEWLEWLAKQPKSEFEHEHMC